MHPRSVQLTAAAGTGRLRYPKRTVTETAFSSHHGLFRFTRLPFGLANSAASFQRVIDAILPEVKRQSVLVYLDDIIAYSKSVTEHFVHVRTVLALLQKAG